MPAIPVLVAIVVAAGSDAPAREMSLARWRSGEGVADLEVRVGPEAGDRPLAIGEGPVSGRKVPPACVADVCQPRVEVPGLATSARRFHRTELFATMLDRAGIEPLATIAWIFARTGLRVDWSPPSRGTGDPAPWGSFSVRLRLRLDALNRPALLERDATRDGRHTWRSVLAPPRA